LTKLEGCYVLFLDV